MQTEDGCMEAQAGRIVREDTSITIEAPCIVKQSQCLSWLNIAKTTMTDGHPVKILLDLSGVTEFSLTHSQIRELAHRSDNQRVLAAGGRLAIVAPSSLSYGLARMYQICNLGLGERINVVRKRTAAQEWLRDESVRTAQPEPCAYPRRGYHAMAPEEQT